MSNIARAATTFFFLSLVTESLGQYRAFQWTFGNNFIQTALAECQKLPITVESLDPTNPSAVGVPPYYMFAFELGGVPTITPLGSSQLTWQVNHKQGAGLMLMMMDSNGSTGGIPPSLYTVESATDTSCQAPAPDTSKLAAITPNITGTLHTCEPWGLTIKGGQKPYTVVLSALNSPILTNVTMGPDDDVFTFPDRADPNGQLMASVVDGTGAWGISTSTVQTTGNTNTSCVGLVSSSKTSAEIAKEAQDRQNAANEAESQRHLRLILGIVFGLGVPLVIGLAVLFYLYQRRRRLGPDNGIWDVTDHNAMPRPWFPNNATEMREVDAASQVVSTPGSKHSGYATPGSPSSMPFMQVTPIPPIYFDHEIAQSSVAGSPPTTATASAYASPSGSGSTSAYSQGRPPRTPPASAQVLDARLRKAREARQGRPQASSQGSLHQAGPSGAVPPHLVAAALDPETQPDIIIQHRDGGVVQELPPPYMDRARGPSPAPGARAS